MSDVKPEPKAPRRRQQTGRSPSYPSVSLPRAVQRVGELYEHERQYPVAAATVPALWGYQNLNGPAGLTLSALKKFGLTEDEGTKDARTVRVTDLAVQILNHPSSDARAAAIKDAALMPPIHREMWEEYGTKLPSDANLMWRLTRTRGFTETGAKEFIREWRETMEFARLTSDDASAAHISDRADLEDNLEVELVPGVTARVSDPNATVPDREAEPEPERVPSGSTQAHGHWQRVQLPHGLTVGGPTAPPSSDQIQQYPIPIALSGRPPVQVAGAFPLSEAEWTQFMAVLTAMKPVLVGDPAPPVPPEAPEDPE